MKRISISLLATLIALALALASCGGDDSDPDPGASSGTSAGTGSDGDGDSGKQTVEFSVLEADSSATGAVREAAISAEPFAIRNGGKVDGIDQKGLLKLLDRIERENDLQGSDQFELTRKNLSFDGLEVSGEKKSFEVRAPGESGTVYLARGTVGGEITYDCEVRGEAPCPEDGDWTQLEDSFDVVNVPEEVQAEINANAEDADTKAKLRTAQTAIETLATDQNGSYAKADPDALIAIESTLEGAAIAVRAKKDSYRLARKSESGTVFSLSRKSDGSIEYLCNDPDAGGCPESGGWATPPPG